MAPKKRTTRASPATTTTTTTPITNAQLKELIDQGVADALAACDADRSRNGEDNHDSGTGVRRQAPLAREMETVFRKSYCIMENQIKFATCTLLGKPNQAQQQPPKKQGAIAYTAGSSERKEYAGTLPLCNKSPAATNNQKNLTCYECGNQGHYKSDCPELKNRNHENQAEDTGARGMVLDPLLTKLEFPQELSKVHNTFHVSNLKKCYANEPLAVPLDRLHFDDKLHFVEEPIEIIDREVKRLKRSRIPLVQSSMETQEGLSSRGNMNETIQREVAFDLIRDALSAIFGLSELKGERGLTLPETYSTATQFWGCYTASTNKVNDVGAKTSIKLLDDLNMPELEDFVYSDDDEDVGAEADMNNLDAFMPVSPIPATRIHKHHPVEQIIRDLNSIPQTRRMTKNLEEHGLFSSVQ
ncbi:putative reverse transcriptase domain-containing protein [Tanacetum coccineum]|uniref:Reverse transcriptase domain-containing protein n=1 Tax=Tanacetum coccineum TaxID=301880 RepID=A0ABQ5F804_9ASTR